LQSPSLENPAEGLFTSEFTGQAVVQARWIRRLLKVWHSHKSRVYFLQSTLWIADSQLHGQCIPETADCKSLDDLKTKTKFIMLPLPLIIWHEHTTRQYPLRINEPSEAMDDPDQIKSYVHAYEWGGPTSALQLDHLRNLSRMIKPGDTVLDLACGPGALLLELAALYPDCKFIGADLSPNMLTYLEQEAASRNLANVSVLLEDIRTLPSLGNTKVDLIMTTSALHHVPSSVGVREVFQRMRELLRPDGGFYIFDFGLLKSPKTRRIMVNEVARVAHPITAHDYDVSLQAAYPISEIIQLARNELPAPFSIKVCAIADFFYLMHSKPRTDQALNVKGYIERRWKELSFKYKAEHVMLRLLRRQVASPS
jgi:arsenite methyltransferase